MSLQYQSEDLLKAHGIGGVFDLAFDIYRKHFRPLVTIVAVLLLPMQTLLFLFFNTWLKPLSLFADAHNEDAGASLLMIGGGMLIGYPQAGVPGLLSLLLLAIASAPVAAAIADIYRGKSPSWLACYQRVFPQIPRVLLGWSIVFLALVAVLMFSTIISMFVLGIVAILFASKVPIAVSIILGVILLLVPYVLGMTVLAFYFGFTTPLIVLEDMPVTLIPSRNWQLVDRRRALKTWAALVFVPIVFFVVQLLMLGSISSFLSLFTIWPTLRYLIETGMTVLLIVFLQPYLLIFINVLYFDFRIQRDCLDIRLLMSQSSTFSYEDVRR